MTCSLRLIGKTHLVEAIDVIVGWLAGRLYPIPGCGIKANCCPAFQGMDRRGPCFLASGGQGVRPGRKEAGLNQPKRAPTNHRGLPRRRGCRVMRKGASRRDRPGKSTRPKRMCAFGSMRRAGREPPESSNHSRAASISTLIGHPGAGQTLGSRQNPWTQTPRPWMIICAARSFSTSPDFRICALFRQASKNAMSTLRG
jgi:hypothetical protein